MKTHGVEIPLDDLLTTLPPTAQRLLVAAQRIIIEEGFEKLTLQKIHEYSGENTSAIKYYFGNKDGLIASIVDAMVHDECIAVTDDMLQVSDDRRVEHLVENLRELSQPSDSMRVFYDVFPHALRDPELHERLRLLYRWYHEIQLLWVGAREPLDEDSRRRADGLASLLSAVVDGLALQALINSEPNDRAALEVFQLMLSRTLGEILGRSLTLEPSADEGALPPETH